MTAAGYSGKRRSAALILLSPGLLIFAGVVIVPLIMTLLLSLHGWSMNRGIDPSISLHNYVEVITDGYFAEVFFRTLRISLIVTLLCVLIGAPEAYILRRMKRTWRAVFLLVVVAPLLISVVAGTLGWALIMGGNGVLSKGLQQFGLVSRSVSLMYTETGIVIALVHVLVPFMVLAAAAALSRIDDNVTAAAVSLGATPSVVFRRIILPQAMPGILSGSIIVFSLAASAFATPAIIGGRRLKVAATLAYDEFLNTLNWPLGAAVAVLLLIGIVATVMGCNRWLERHYSQIFA